MGNDGQVFRNLGEPILQGPERNQDRAVDSRAGVLEWLPDVDESVGLPCVPPVPELVG
jgi:hypothetical protein